MTDHLKLAWGGQIYDASLSGTPVEIWECTLALLAPSLPDPFTLAATVVPLVQQYHQRADTQINESVALEFWKLNYFSSVAPFHQTTDPTVGGTFPANIRGAGGTGGNQPTSSAYRVSLDNGTRDRRARGGFFVPRPSLSITYGGRYAPGDVQLAADSAETFLGALNAIPGISVGVFSKADPSFTTSSRLRVGDVPDNISRRRNDLREAYEQRALP